jgi:uncharacterized LabA/DUF88 family protein
MIQQNITPKIYAFIDSQNLNLAIRDLGWKIDWRRLRRYLKNKFGVSKAILFLGKVQGNEKMYKFLRHVGFDIVFKPVINDHTGKPKGNCDAELILHCARIEYDNFDKAIIISGDGDFYCLIDFLIKENKLLKIGIPSRKNFSSLFTKFRKYFFFIDDLEHLLTYKKRAHTRL